MKRIVSMVLAVLMIISILPVSVFAGAMEDSLSDANFTVIDNDQSTLAPGVTMNELVVHNSRNERVEMYVTTVDTTVDTVKVMANYMDNQNSVFGMQTLSAQVAALEAKKPEPFKVVAGINASYYNVTTGQPTGAFVMEGIDASASGDSYSFFAVLKDGTYMIGAKGEYSKYKDQMQEAIGGWIHLVKDGEVQSGLDKTTLYPRQTLGLTADGKLIIMTADGSQAPVTVGITIQEQAEIMKELGCVEAIHLDGGNSLTFGAIREGEDTFKTVNKPSGGAERAVSNTLVIVSTAVADGTFDHAVIKSDYEYLAPNSTYTFTAFGVDATNAAAEIPATAVWTLSDSSFGTISNGKFVSNGKLGEVDIQLTDGGKVVGSRTINIVNPTVASFALEDTTVPYGKAATLPLTALYGDFAIYTDETHYSFVVDAATAGSMDGFKFSATNDENVKSAVVTATYKYAENITDTITVKFGKGSEILFDFEDGDISDWQGTDTINAWIDAQNAANGTAIPKPETYSNNIYTQSSSVFLASQENGGKVKTGEYALGFRLNHMNLTNVNSWVYNYLYYTGETKVLRDVAAGKTAIRLGMWVYVPDVTNIAFRLVRGKDTDGSLGIAYSYMTSDYDGVKTSYATNYEIPEAGWIYIYYDLTDLAENVKQTTSVYNPASPSVYYPAFLQLFSGSATDTMNDIIYYIDDITLDYSDVTEDRDAPTISDMEVCYDTANFVALNGQTVNSNLLSFSAKVTDVSGNSNMTGLNYATAKIYIDGIDVSGNNGFKATNGYITLNDVYLTNGTHSVAFVIFDNQGNETRVTKTITVNGSATNSVVSVVGHNEGNNVPKAGSVYYIDIKVSDAAAVSEIVTTLKLNTANRFEYNNIICADGVTAEVSYDALDFEMTVKLAHDGSLSGETVLASIPVRVWAWDEMATGKPASDQFATGAIPVIDIECETVYGAVTYTDSTYRNYVCGFYGVLDVATELDNKTAWHAHSATAVADKDATCTKDGYTGRTYCEACASVIVWGTVVPATGHDHKVVDNKLVCACGDVNIVNGLYNVDGLNYYVLAGELATGWIAVGEDWYYFDSTSYAGVDGEQYADNGIKFVFDQGRVTDGVWVRNASGLRYWYGPGYYKDTSLDTASCKPYEIDGKTYLFSRNGYMQTGVVYWMYRLLGHTGETLYYDCGTDGVATLLSGVYNNRFYLDGVQQLAYQLVEFEGDYYFISDGHKIAKNTKLYLSEKYVSGKMFADGRAIQSGTYYFDAEGKMEIPQMKNGVVDDYLYINDVKQTRYKLVEYDGNFYFVNDGDKVAKSVKLYLSEKYVSGKTFADGRTIQPGTYYFDAEGKMEIPERKNGVVGDYLYINDVKQLAYQLVEFDGDFYFVNDGHKIAKNTKIYLADRFVSGKTFADGRTINPGYYYFDAEGKMEIPQMKNGVVDGFLYIDDVKQTRYKLVEFGGNFYFINDGDKVAVDRKLYLSEKYVAGMTFADGRAIQPGTYYFDAEGKMVVPELKNGVVDGFLYIDDVKQLAYQLVEFEGNYYFVNDGHKVATSTRLYLSERFVSGKTFADGSAIAIGYYEFDENGKMILN